MSDEVQPALDLTSQLLSRLFDVLPSLVAAVIVLVGGVALAGVFRLLTRVVAARLGLDALAERFGVARFLYALQIRGGLSALLANFVALLVVLLTVSTSAEVVGLRGIAEGVAAVVEFLPRVVSACVVALFGFAAADIGSRVVEGVGRQRDSLVSPKFIGTIVYYLILAVVLTTSVQHLGIETDLINLLIAIGVGGAVGSFALAFAWASRGLLQDVLSRPYVLYQVSIGDVVELGAHRGEVMELGVVSVVLRGTDAERVVLPYRRFMSKSGFRAHGADRG